jgi:hypothetical protein
MLKSSQQKGFRGQGLVEYVLILAMTVVGALIALQVTGYSVRDVYCAAARGLGATDVCAGQQVYCEDDFENLDNWKTNWGTFTNPDGQICTSGAAKNYSTCSQDMSNMSDYSVYLTDAQLKKGNGYGVFFRGSNLDGRTNGYIVQYDPGWAGGSVIIRKWIDGRELEPFAVYRMPGYSWYSAAHDMRVDVEGDTFTVYLDDQKILVGQDDTYSEGGIGLRSWDSTEVCLDGIKVAELAKEGAQ